MSEQSVNGTATQALDRRVAGQSVIEKLRDLAAERPPTWRQRVFGIRPVHPDMKSWLAGARGERIVGAVLKKLGPEWLVLHAVPVGDAHTDIDHIVIGPAGAFTINTKHHKGKTVWAGNRVLKINGQNTDHLRNSRSEAKRAAKLLTAAAGVEAPVRPVIALVDAGKVTVKENLTDVAVVRAGELVAWLNNQVPVLLDEDLTQLRAAALAPDTWHSDPASVLTDWDAAGWLDRYERFLRAAYRRYMAWGVAIAAPAVPMAAWTVNHLVTGLS